MELDLLALAAHRDDVEQTCGGTLLRMAGQGARTGILDLTAGEMGTRGTAQERAREAARAAKLLQVIWRGNLDLPDGGLEMRQEYLRAIAAVLRKLRPRVLLVPYPQARHPDHAMAGKLGYKAAFLAGLKRLKLPGGEEAFRPRTVLYASLYARRAPSLIMDISEQFETRMRALEAYGSQYADQPAGKRIFPAAAEIRPRVEALARYFGMLAGVRYGEPFISPTPLAAREPRDLDYDTFTQGGIITPY